MIINPNAITGNDFETIYKLTMDTINQSSLSSDVKKEFIESLESTRLTHDMSAIMTINMIVAMSTYNSELTGIYSHILRLSCDVENLNKKLSEAESKISIHGNVMQSIENSYFDLESDVDSLNERLDNVENMVGLAFDAITEHDTKLIDLDTKISMIEMKNAAQTKKEAT